MIEKTVVDRILRRVHHGRVLLRYWDGEERCYGSASPVVHVKLNSPAVVRRAALSASLAFGEGYLHGEVEIAEDDLDALFWVIARNRSSVRALLPLRRLYRTERIRRGSQRTQISRHYDVGNDYYRLFLDESLTYSCAYFENDDDTLALAQQHKLDHVLRKARLEPGQRVIDIGSGWGHLAVAAAKACDVEVLGVTLSHEQVAESRAYAAREGVGDRVRFELMNYQDLLDSSDPGLRDPFDRVLSVGMFEHVGRDGHGTFFDVVNRSLVPGGVGVLHTITNQRLQSNDAWVDRYIFPGGFLPTVSEIEGMLAGRGLWSIDRENLWRNYARTLSCWRERLRANRTAIIAMFDEEFYRMLDLWLAGSKAAFDYGTLGLAQFVFTRGKPSSWPLTRRDLYRTALTGSQDPSTRKNRTRCPVAHISVRPNGRGRLRTRTREVLKELHHGRHRP